MRRRERIVTRRWPHDDHHLALVSTPRTDILVENALVDGAAVDESLPHESPVDREVAAGPTVDGGSPGELRFAQATGPFDGYERRVAIGDDEIVETTRATFTIPWFRWLLRWPIRLTLARRLAYPGWWAPPDRVEPRQLTILGLLAAASVSAAFVNTLFTQTAEFAADDFGVGETGIGIAGAVVRAGIVIALPAAVIADRIGRRRVLVAAAWIAPTASVLGALAPSFELLVASQTIARPMGIALAFVIGVVAAEEMPRNSRAWAVSVLAMAAGFGAGVAVMSLRLADVGDGGWRLVYLVAAAWLVIAIDLARRLPETRRFVAETRRTDHPRGFDRRRFALLATVAFAGNVFIAPASFFQNSYLSDVRDFSGGQIGLFSIIVGTPAGIGLIIGARIAERSGRRRLISLGLPLSTAAVVVAFSVGGPPLWLASFSAAVLGSAIYPAMQVYRTELFPTASRTRASGFVIAAALVGGIGGLVLTGRLIDAGWSYSSVMLMLASGQLVATLLVVVGYPETAHRELEELNPEDEALGWSDVTTAETEAVTATIDGPADDDGEDGAAGAVTRRAPPRTG